MVDAMMVPPAHQYNDAGVGGWIGSRTTSHSHGEPPRGLGGRRSRLAFPMLAMFTAICIGYLSIAATVMSTDPYDIYPWGVRMQFAANDVPRDNVVRWIDAITKDKSINTFLVGGSTTAMYSPDDIEAALGGNTVAYNLIYGGPRPLDRDIVLDQLAENSRSQRVIITYDWMYVLDPETMRHGFPEFLYDQEVTDDIRMVDFRSVRRTISILLGHTRYDSMDSERYAKFVKQQYSSFQKPSQMAALRSLVDEYRPTIDAPSGRTCDSFNAMDVQLVPRVRNFAARGVKIDIIMPILSYANYYFHISDISSTLLDQVMLSRRCLVEAVKGLPNVRIFAFDDDPAIAGDLANFRDPGHVYDPDVLKLTLSSLSTGQHMLTPANIGEYEQRIRAEVKKYQVKNTYLEQRADREQK
jgi:hypothetical protein